MTLHVELVVPEGEVWAGPAQRVIAKTLDGDIGVLTGHTPVLGILAGGSVVRILPEETAADGEIAAAVGGGFLSIADDRVSILARQAQLGTDVTSSAVRAELEAELADAASSGQGAEESATARYLRALLRAAGDEA